MNRQLLIGLNCLLLTVSPAVAQERLNLSVDRVVSAIDDRFQQSWQAEQVVPAEVADDAEFIRRLYLDLAGRIPAVSELRAFLADPARDKRAQIVSQLLDSPASVRHFTTVWRNALIPQANSQPEFRGLIPGFQAWLWERISAGQPYDQIVREIITSELNVSNGAALAATTSPDAFFVVRELKPENLAAGTARAFLGVRLDCAQCHDHPFDKWQQQQFWNMAAFYAGFSRPEDADRDTPAMMLSMAENRDARSIRIPGTEDVVPAVFLTGGSPDWNQQPQQTARDVLADWIVDPQNPWFARMAVNRMWAQFFGRGIVDPVDDFSDNNPPSHPEVLDLLADDFVAGGYDLKRLVRVITATRVYQLSSRQTHTSQQDPSHFARAVLRGLSPEQFFDSLAEAVGFYQPYRSDNPFVVDTDSPRAQFLDLFRDSAESSLDRETTILQALAMMNGEFISNATSLNDSQTLKAVIEFPAMTDAQKLETLFLAALSRPPSETEQQRFGEYLSTGGAAGNKQAAMADIFWVLLNSSEFLLNH
ncbi:MAG: DUF1549 and DUF1553 domain-containing protein [Fuerstiella sp.]